MEVIGEKERKVEGALGNNFESLEVSHALWNKLPCLAQSRGHGWSGSLGLAIGWAPGGRRHSPRAIVRLNSSCARAGEDLASCILEAFFQICLTRNYRSVILIKYVYDKGLKDSNSSSKVKVHILVLKFIFYESVLVNQGVSNYLVNVV
ncbi:hypothetical protein KFK09_028575 [Dendrobium nobile]|uniref:Uncharacterized protein n=1 Tax=Dendrobium nobile TaxID=94219 RepID=A0A8T3A304_DENNO|nr:hypothetical protein KFK09_028575 [Dendrobium nobile]